MVTIKDLVVEEFDGAASSSSSSSKASVSDLDAGEISSALSGFQLNNDNDKNRENEGCGLDELFDEDPVGAREGTKKGDQNEDGDTTSLSGYELAGLFGEDCTKEEGEGDGDGEGSTGDTDSSEGYEYEAPPTDFKSWQPFKDFDWETYGGASAAEIEETITSIAALIDPETEWEDKAQYALRALQPIISAYESRFSEPGLTWVQPEIERIFCQEAAQAGSPSTSPLASNRYLYNSDTFVVDESYCLHNARLDCSCWFDMMGNAGIEKFPAQHRQRKEMVEFASKLMVQLLLLLAVYGEENELFGGDVNEIKMYVEAVPELTLANVVNYYKGAMDDTSDDSGVDSDDNDSMYGFNDHEAFLRVDSTFIALSTNSLSVYLSWHEIIRELCETDDENDIGVDTDTKKTYDQDLNVPEVTEYWKTREAIEKQNQDYPPLTPAQAHFGKIIAFVGRRALALGICRWQKGHLFLECTPIEYWQFNDIVDNIADGSHGNAAFELSDYKYCDGQVEVEQPRYPIRVINTHTLEFEYDKILFRKNYAILSHMWGKGEVTFQQAEKLWANVREQDIDDELEAIAIALHDPDCELEDSQRRGIIIRKTVLEGEKATIVKARLKRKADEAAAKGKPLNVPVVSDKPVDIQPKLRGSRTTMKRAMTTSGAKAMDNPGEAKLMNAIKTARKMGFEYLWSDTCCINKADNSELVESISSMGDWYQNAAVCLIYLHDIDECEIDRIKGGTMWAGRGWTLQEVVMCPRAVFFNSRWKELFDSAHKARSSRMAILCNAPKELLWHGRRPDIAASTVLCIANERKTTRSEDRAYSLMGILGVRMPADYGEGQSKAVSRLLEIVIHVRSDVSVFNWSGLIHGSHQPARSMYPKEFGGYGFIEMDSKLALPRPLIAQSEITLGHSGVHARFEILQAQFTVKGVGGNETALRALEYLDTSLEGAPESSPDHTMLCNVSGTFGTPPIEVKLACSRQTLRKQLEAEKEKVLGRESATQWVLARFARLEGAYWFLAELQFDTQIVDDGLFSHVFKGSQAQRVSAEGMSVSGNVEGIGSVGKFMHYLENRGFQARRIPAEVDQKNIPREGLHGVYLWVS